MEATELLTLETPMESPEEERAEPRYTARAGVKVSLQAPPEIVTDDAVVADISLRGIGILVDQYMEPGKHVIVHMGTQRLETEVRHCTREESQYRVGIVVHRATDSAVEPERDWASLIRSSRKTGEDGFSL